MKKQELLNIFDEELLDKLFGFCYARTRDSYEAEELCSDIVYALIKAANTEGEIESIYPFVWRVARNVYADFSNNRRKRADNAYQGDADELLSGLAEDEEDNAVEQIKAVYRRIAFLTRAYREVMIMFYIDGLSTAKIAKKQGTSEGAVRQRLFSARQKIKSEVEKMTDTYNKPITLDKVDFEIWGTGNPAWGDPREGFERMLSKHIVWLCHKKPMSASEIAEELNVPTLYVEEELEILRKGKNGKYGLLRRLDSGKYAMNFVLIDKETVEEAHRIYTQNLPKICDIISSYIYEHKEEYLSFPYLNKKVDMNLILWQQITHLSGAFSDAVRRILKNKYFADVPGFDRPFSVFGYVSNGKHYGGGWDGIQANSVCGYKYVHFDNIYITRIKKHFGCGHDVANDALLQLALMSIDGLSISSLEEKAKEHAAKAIECGYLYRDGDMLYTKILVSNINDSDKLFGISNEFCQNSNKYFGVEADVVAEKIAELIKKTIPDYLMSEWGFANDIANFPILDAVVECLIEKGVLTPPENGIGAEGCWVSVMK